jgi:DNA-binding response OmpR family regulator
MIEVHRKSPVAFIDGREVFLSPSDYLLMIAFGIMGNRLVETDLLIDSSLGYPVRLPGDFKILHVRMSRLKKKIGGDTIRSFPRRGYAFVKPIRFIGE